MNVGWSILVGIFIDHGLYKNRSWKLLLLRKKNTHNGVIKKNLTM